MMRPLLLVDSGCRSGCQLQRLLQKAGLPVAVVGNLLEALTLLLTGPEGVTGYRVLIVSGAQDHPAFDYLESLLPVVSLPDRARTADDDSAPADGCSQAQRLIETLASLGLAEPAAVGDA